MTNARKAWMAPFLALSLLTAIPACSSGPTHESTGEYIDDAAITTKVKAAIVKDEMLNPFQIGVETYKNVVQLSGFVDSTATKAHAATVAAGVAGVRDVKNGLVVK